MRDYTFYQGARFYISNLFRSQRFDVDRLDMSWADDERPDFCRGLRVVDHKEGHTEMVDGEAADNLIYALAFISCKDGTRDADVDAYLQKSLETKNFSEVNLEKAELAKPQQDLLH